METNSKPSTPETEAEEIEYENILDQPKEFVVNIQNPRSIPGPKKTKQISFQLSIENAEDILPLVNSDHVRRTFLEFMWLEENLSTRYDEEAIPTLYKTPKLPYQSDFYHIVKQQKALSEFTEACLLHHSDLRSDSLVQLFYQSDLTLDELEEFLAGNVSEDFLKDIWIKQGITKAPEVDYWDFVTSEEYYDEVIRK